MAHHGAAALGTLLCLPHSLLAVQAVPVVVLPFNSQVPPVARVNQPYSFQISASTFAPAPQNFMYALSNQPRWLSIDSATRTLSGSPRLDDAGSVGFTLSAEDDTGIAHMTCTLVVSSNLAPQQNGDLSSNIVASTNLSSAQPPIMTILPGTAFHLGFRYAPFKDAAQRKLLYYATLCDHTPLPSWLAFNFNSLAFSGTAPQLSAYPQSWRIDLIASDVPGFSGASASFTVAIATEQLVFVPISQILRVKQGTHVRLTMLRGQLYKNEQQLDLSEIQDAVADVPSWLSFNASTLVIEGDVPLNPGNQSITVSVTDKTGSMATATLYLVAGGVTLFEHSIGNIIAYAGQKLDHHFTDALFTIPVVNLRVSMFSSATRLQFDAKRLRLTGLVPTKPSQPPVKATLEVEASGIEPQRQVFIIKIEASASAGPIASTGLMTSRISATQSSTPHAKACESKKHASCSVTQNFVVAVIVLSVTAAILLAVCLTLCYHQRRVPNVHYCLRTSLKRMMPEPDAPLRNHLGSAILHGIWSPEEHGKTSTMALPQTQAEVPPQLDVRLPLHSEMRRSTQGNRISHVSRGSSLGFGGEEAIMADSNIPEYGRESHLLQTLHPSFRVPVSMARLSRKPSETSPTKLVLRNLQFKRRSRFDTETNTSEPSIGRQASLKNVMARRGLRESWDLPAITPRSSDRASLSTRSSALSTRPSDFPRPPTMSSRSGSTSRHDHERAPQQRKTVRLVDTSKGLSDERPIDIRRQSYIRLRAISGLQHPFFAHGSRARPITTGRSDRTSTVLTNLEGIKHSPKGNSVMTSCPQSSSFLDLHYANPQQHGYPTPFTGFSSSDEDAGAERESDLERVSIPSSTSREDVSQPSRLPKYQRF